MTRVLALAAIQLACVGLPAFAGPDTRDPLPNWNDGPSKAAIVGFVTKVTTDGSPEFVQPSDRIAVFDNDGTLWSEQPVYVQFAFTLDRVRALAPQHPDWKEKEQFKSILAGDLKAFAATGEKGVVEVVMATHTGLTTEEFEKTVKNWIATAKHPQTGKLKFELHNGEPVLVKLPEVDLVDDGSGKPVGIQQVVGRRPVMAFGNSDGDLPMLQWTAAGDGARFPLIVHHTDAEREGAYDRQSSIGRLDKALDEANARQWTVVDMKRDWKVVFPFQKEQQP